MIRNMSLALAASASLLGVGTLQALAIDSEAPTSEPRVIYSQTPVNPPMPIRVAYNDRSNMGGGFIEFLFSGGQSGNPGYAQPRYEQQPAYEPMPGYRRGLPPMDPQDAMRDESIEPGRQGFDPRYEKQLVEYDGRQSPGTIVIDTPNKFLYLVQGNGKALRYGIGGGQARFRMGWREDDLCQEGMAGLDAAAGNAEAPSRFAAPHGRRSGKPARCAGDVSRFVALPHSWLERALDHRHCGVVGLHPDAQPGRHRSLWPGQRRHPCHRDVRRPNATNKSGRPHERPLSFFHFK